MTAPMSIEAWRADVASRRPAPTAAQMAILKAARRSSEQQNAAPGPTETAPAMTAQKEEQHETTPA